MKGRGWLWASLVSAGLVLFAVFVWPTPFTYTTFECDDGSEEIGRHPRWGGPTQFLTPDGWRDRKDELDAGAPPRVRRTLAAIRRSLAARKCYLLELKAELIRQETGNFPATLDELVSAENPAKLPLTAEEIASGEPTGMDPWGNPISYLISRAVHSNGSLSEVASVNSMGADGVCDTEDDISRFDLSSVDDR